MHLRLLSSTILFLYIFIKNKIGSRSCCITIHYVVSSFLALLEILADSGARMLLLFYWHKFCTNPSSLHILMEILIVMATNIDYFDDHNLINLTFICYSIYSSNLKDHKCCAKNINPILSSFVTKTFINCYITPYLVPCYIFGFILVHIKNWRFELRDSVVEMRVRTYRLKHKCKSVENKENRLQSIYSKARDSYNL